MTQNEPYAHVHHRIAEAVVKGWPSWECSEADVLLIVERYTNLTDDPKAIAAAVKCPLSFVEAILAEAREYGLLDEADARWRAA